MIRYYNSHKFKVSFLGIPKTGSTSVRAALEINVQKDWSHWPEHSFVFTVLRDPVDRFISMYYEAVRQNRTQAETFESYIESINNHGFWDIHNRPQSHFFKQPLSKVYCLDLIIELEKDFEINVPKLNASEVEIIPTVEQLNWIKETYNQDYELYKRYKK